MVTLEWLKAVFPRAGYGYLEAIIAELPRLEDAGILKNELRLVHFLAQAAAETAGFTISVESGRYSAERLLKVFPKYFKSLSEAQAYAGRPKAIFNRTYGGRLGNTLPGDGFKYRGRGILQITGKSAYKRYGDIIGVNLVDDPDKAADASNALKIAIAYWSDLGLNEWADKDDILAVSRGINGGNPRRNIQPNGFADRKAWLAVLKRVTSDGQTMPEPEAAGSLREGSQGREVEKVQSLLRARGYAPGAIDGIYGANTRRAVALFQADHELEGKGGVWLASYLPELEAAPSVQEERKDVTAGDLRRAGDPAVTGMTWAQRILAFLGIGGAITGGVSEGASNFPSLVTQYQPVIDTLSPLFRFVATNGWVLVIIAAVAGLAFARYAIAKMVRAYRHGDYQGPYREVR